MYQVMGSGIVLAAISAAVAFQSATPTVQVPLEPSGPWTIEYAESMCVLSRQFGAGKQQLTLGFRPAPLSNNFRFGLLMPDRSSRVVRGKAQIRLDGQMLYAPFVRGPVKADGLNIVQIDTERDKVSRLDQVHRLGIAAGKLNVELSLTDTGAAMKALETCEKDLLVNWGMDPAVVASLQSYPTQRGGILAMFSTDDYPRAALAKNEEGTTGVRVRIGKDGKVSDCNVLESSGSQALDEQTCRIILTRARFEPARTKSGEAVDSIILQRIRWEIP